MNSLALQHQISNALATHGKISGMTQTELAEHTGAGPRCISRALGEMGTVSRSGRGVSGSPYRYEYVPATVFCDDMAPKYEERPFWTFWFAWPVAFTMFGMLINYIRYS